tara:strand:- start:56 stop:373 length:318 start_codon:yes stop_codon:yes gene_type:complete
MIDITKAQAGQTTTNGTNGDWIVTLDKEQIYTLPSYFTVQDTFLVRDIIEKMMGMEGQAVKEQEQQLNLVKLQHVVSNGDAKLEALLRENERLADALQQSQLEVV